MKRRVRKTRFTENLLMATGVAFALAWVVVNSQSEAAKNYAAQRADILAQRRASEAAEYEKQLEANKANQRYESACVMPHYWLGVEPNWYPKAIAISEGEAVIHGKTDNPVKNGVVVCDDRGTTGVVFRGVVTDVAVSDSQRLINQRFSDALGWHEGARRSDVSVKNQQ